MSTKVLIIEDNNDIRENIVEILELAAYTVFAAENGKIGVELALKNKPDIILLDLKMSPKTGFQIADEFKNSHVFKDVPIIAMTGFFTEKQHFLMMKLCGIKTSILKPFRPVNLITKIEFALGNRLEEYDTDGT